MRKNTANDRPRSWREELQTLPSDWTLPFRWFNWTMTWFSWALSHWALLDVLAHLGTFSILIAVISYFADSGNRIKQKHYQAWQVINTAQGKGGSGGRIEALQELNRDHVSLTGVDASGAFLSQIRLQHGHLERCDLHSADLRRSDMTDADLSVSNLRGANFRESNLTGADLHDSELQDSDLNGAILAGANLARADLSRTDLRNADLSTVKWQGISSMQLSNIYGVRNAPPGFLPLAQKLGAISQPSDEEWNVLLRKVTPDSN